MPVCARTPQSSGSAPSTRRLRGHLHRLAPLAACPTIRGHSTGLDALSSGRIHAILVRFASPCKQERALSCGAKHDPTISTDAREVGMDEAIPLQEAANRFGVKVTRLRKAADEGRLEVKRLPGSRDRLVRPSEGRRFFKNRREGRLTGGGTARRNLTGHPRAEKRARVISGANSKRGTGKTSTTDNHGAAL